MGAEAIKAIIVGNDIKLANEMQANMPDYIAASPVRFSEAKDKLENGIDGAQIELLIMNVDEEPSQALSIYKDIKQGPDKKKYRSLAVILITADEFESHCLDFFDYGDPRFYSGSFEDSDFFIELNDALDEAQDLAEQDFDDDIDTEEETISVETSPEKLMGMAFEISPEDGPIRIAAYDDKKVKEALSSAINRGKEQAKQVYEALEAAMEEDPSLAESIKAKLSKTKEKTIKKIDYSDAKTWKKVHPAIKEVHKSISKEKAIELLEDEENPPVRQEDHRNDWNKKTVNVSEQRIPASTASYVQSADGFTTKNGYFVPRNALPNEQQPKSNVRQQQTTSNNVMKHAVVNNMVSTQPTILIVDNDPNTLKAFKLFLGNVYDVEMTDSSMKAIDFVVRNRVDIVAIEYNMMGVPGLSILKSIKNQPQGKSIKAFMLMDDKRRKFEIDNVKSTPGVAGIIMKPVVKKQLFYAINNS